MTTKKKKRYRVVFRRSSPVLKAIILVAIVLSTAALVVLSAAKERATDRYNAMRMQAAILQESNEALDIRIDDMGSIDSIIQIAIEELGLVPPDTTIFNPGN